MPVQRADARRNYARILAVAAPDAEAHRLLALTVAGVSPRG